MLKAKKNWVYLVTLYHKVDRIYGVNQGVYKMHAATRPVLLFLASKFYLFLSVHKPTFCDHMEDLRHSL
jgi:hypothetical protein